MLARDGGVLDREVNQSLHRRGQPRPWLHRALARGAVLVFSKIMAPIRTDIYYIHPSDLRQKTFGTPYTNKSAVHKNLLYIQAVQLNLLKKYT